MYSKGKTIAERYMVLCGGSIKPLADLGTPKKAYKDVEKGQQYRTYVDLCSAEISELELLDI